jgi:hypothetical protein
MRRFFLARTAASSWLEVAQMRLILLMAIDGAAAIDFVVVQHYRCNAYGVLSLWMMK